MWKPIVCLVVITACVPPATWGAPTAATEGGDPMVAAGGRSCVEVVQCLAGCAAEAACFQACVDQADPSARGAVDALLACNAGGGECDAELAACRDDGGGVVATAGVAMGPTSPDVPGQPHSNADLLPWLTGDWIGSRHQFTFYADGRVRRSDHAAMVEDHPGTSDDRRCASVGNDLGTVRQEGDLLIMDFTDRSASTCGVRETNAATVVRYRITWFDNAYDDDPYLQLILVDIDCTDGAMWCNDGMRRR